MPRRALATVSAAVGPPAGLAGGFAYNRLKAAAADAQGDPLLSKAVAPLTAGIETLKGLGGKLPAGARRARPTSAPSRA